MFFLADVKRKDIFEILNLLCAMMFYEDGWILEIPKYVHFQLYKTVKIALQHVHSGIEASIIQLFE